jgi:3-carboxy-cis,cis-muconate cycloisomerase
VSEGGLFDAVLARGGAREAVSDRAWLQAMLDVEAALARAEAAAGVIPAEHAEAIAVA